MSVEEANLLEAAIGGDRSAMGRLLVRHDPRLRRKMVGWIAPQLDPLISGRSGTPSGKAVEAEAAGLVQVAQARLKDDYRETLWMRYFEGRPVKHIANVMGRTEHAVHMLCNRGLRAQREAMGNTSPYLSSRR